MCAGIFVLLLFSSFPKKLLELFEKILRQYNCYKVVRTQTALLSDLYKIETQLKWEKSQPFLLCSPPLDHIAVKWFITVAEVISRTLAWRRCRNVRDDRCSMVEKC